MRVAFVLLATLAFAAPALANPSGADPTLFIDFDEDGVPDEDMHFSISPPAYVLIEAYVALSCIDEPGEEFTTVSFALSNPLAECPGVTAPPSFFSLLPGNLAIGDPFSGGITVASTECMYGPVVYIGKIELFYLGGECYLKILDHSEYPRWVVDCQSPGQVHYYCNYAWAGIGQDHIYLDEWCPDPPACQITPVENVSWGAIKSLYR
jgi:hypothetical protein